MKSQFSSDWKQKKIQEYIRERYPQELIENTERLCKNCQRVISPNCCPLLPITSEGEDCPYYLPR